MKTFETRAGLALPDETAQGFGLIRPHAGRFSFDAVRIDVQSGSALHANLHS